MSDRIDRVRERLTEQGIDSLALVPGPAMHYLTGFQFMLSDRLLLLIMPAEGEAVAILPNFEESNWSGNVGIRASLFLWDDTEGPADLGREAAAKLPAIETMAVEPLGMRVMEHDILREHFPNAQLVGADGLVQAMRLRKDPEEAEALRRAIAISESALDELLDTVRVGTIERELASRLSSLLLGKGGEGISFGPIVLTGPNSALPHGVPGERAVEAGDILLIDFGTSSAGYHSDITRTFIVGAEPDEQTRQVYEAVKAGNAAGCAACRPGATCDEVHHAAQDGIRTNEFADYMTHRTGHGLGLDVHEPPSVMEGNRLTLEPGMVITVEPGLYLEGWGGVRIEDDMLITEDGAESLTTFSRELRVVGG